jgi:hypothetical protein
MQGIVCWGNKTGAVHGETVTDEFWGAEGDSCLRPVALP